MVQTFDANGIATANTSSATLTVAAPTSSTQDFGYQGPGSIGDFVWADLDGDGVQDAGETGIPGVHVDITTTVNANTVTYTTTTDSAGGYTITGLPLGDYDVAVRTADLPGGVTQSFDADGVSTANTSAVTLTATVPTSAPEDFGYSGPGAIGNLIWNDLDGDGVKDPNEPGIPGVTVSVTTIVNGSPLTFTAVTGPTGAYSVVGLPLGDYTVSVSPASLPAGVVPTFDFDGTDSANTSLVTLTALLPASSTQDFGYRGPGRIGDLVWNDLDGDGFKDANEPGIPGVDIVITTTVAGQTVTYTTTTDADGLYAVAGLALGDYAVNVTPASLPAGATQTFDVDGIATANNSAATLTVAAPTTSLQDFGYRGPGAVGDLIWLDLDGDSARDANEPGMPGVQLTITTEIAGETVTYTLTADAQGAYSLSGLMLGDYTITVTPASLPDGADPTADPDGGADNTADVTLSVATPTNNAQDFGYQGPGQIGDLIWNDLDGDGTKDVGEPGLPGVDVTITTTIAGVDKSVTVTTDANGAYSLSGLPLGDYIVTVDPATLPAGLTNTGDPDGGNDHTADVTLTVTAPTNSAQDFGYQGVGAIGDRVWNDLNADGIQDAGEPGLASIVLTLTTVIAGETVTYSATTDSSGEYLIEGLPLGSFTVTVNPTSIPAGVEQTFDADGTATAGTSIVVLDATTPTSDAQDFGYEGPGVIGDLIWNDLDGDGVKGADEPGIPGVTVTATATIGGSTFTVSTVTAADGSYTIAGLPLATFTVAVDPDTLPAGVEQTGDPDATLDNESTVTLTATNPTSAVEDFGYQGPGEIGDLVWNDLDGDGVKDAGEPGLPGVDVVITTTIAGQIVTYTTTTDAFGAYSISGLPLGDFDVAVTTASLPEGVAITADPDGGADDVAAVSLTATEPNQRRPRLWLPGARSNRRLHLE